MAFGLKDMGKKIIDRDSLNNVVDDSGYWNADVKAEDIPKYEDDGNNRNWLENVANASKILDEHQK